LFLGFQNPAVIQEKIEVSRSPEFSRSPARCISQSLHLRWWCTAAELVRQLGFQGLL